jgi:quercetin dioxygenase-like cupin family protein
MRAHFWPVLIVLLGAKATPAQTPVPVEKEPHHHLQLKNEFVEVIHVVLPAGESTLFHTHSRDRVAVDLTSTMLALQKLNEPEEQPERSIPGDISARANADAPYTHRLRNVGPTTYEVIDVEFLQRPEHPSEKTAASVVAENPSARVYKWNLAAGGATTAHSHELPYALLAVTNLRLKTTAPDGTSTIDDVKAGDVRWVNSKAVHTLTNAGSSDGQIVEIEMK